LVNLKPMKLKQENYHFPNCTRFVQKVLILVTYEWGGKNDWCSSLHNKTLINHSLSCFCVIFHRKNCSSATQKYSTDFRENGTSAVASVLLWLYILVKMHKCVSRCINHCYKKNINDRPLHYSITIMAMLEICSSTCM
jgi:hypothetical protein